MTVANGIKGEKRRQQMILAKTNTDIFGKTIPDDTPVEDLGDHYYLIRNRIFFHARCAIPMSLFVDGKRTTAPEYYDLCSKAYLKMMGRKDLTKRVTYNAAKVSVEDL